MKVARFLFLLLWWPLAAAQTPLANGVVRNEALVTFPQDIVFQLELDPTITLTEAVLTYDVARFSCLDAASSVPVEITGSQLAWTWVMNRSGNPPPGTAVSWHWTLADDAGNQFTTPSQTITLSDDRFEWKQLTNGRITLHWYEGINVGPTLLDAAVAGLAQLEQDMGILLQDDVNIFIYDSSEAMRDAILYVQEWAGGVAFDEYNTILMGVPPNIADTWGRTTIRHELAHLVVGQVGRSCVGGSRPTWLEEGLAVYAEGEPEEEVQQDIANGIADNSFEPVRSLNGAFPAHGTAAGIAYSQSYSVVAFLLEMYGQEKMQQLIAVLSAGEDYDGALEAVYGFNIDGLEQAWRHSIGAADRAIPATPTPLVAAAVPTLHPLPPPQSLPTVVATTVTPTRSPEPAPAGFDSNIAIFFIVVFALCCVGLLLFLLLGFFLWRRNRKRAEESSIKDFADDADKDMSTVDPNPVNPVKKL